ncbi:MAG: OmpH family outer membrane protein [Candidatus Sumerlaeia bacterium]
MTTQTLRRLSLVMALALMLMAPAAFAQSKFGVVDVDKIIARSRTVSQAVKAAEAKLKVRQDQIDAKMTEMQSARQELDRKRSVMSEDQVKAEEDKINRQREAIEDLQHETNKELARIRQEVMPPEVNRIMEAVRQVANTEGYDLVLPAETVLFHTEKVDITPLVIQLLDKNSAAEKPESVEKSSDTDSDEKPKSTRRARPRLPRNND